MWSQKEANTAFRQFLKIITTMYHLGLGSLSPELMLLPLMSSYFTSQMLTTPPIFLVKFCSLSRMSLPTQQLDTITFRISPQVISSMKLFLSSFMFLTHPVHTVVTPHNRIISLVRHLFRCLDEKDQVFKFFPMQPQRLIECVFIKQTTQ